MHRTLSDVDLLLRSAFSTQEVLICKLFFSRPNGLTELIVDKGLIFFSYPLTHKNVVTLLRMWGLLRSLFCELQHIFANAALHNDCEHSINHVSQREQWDCGVACVLIVLQWANISGDTTTLLELGRPLWTIDIFHFLWSHNVEVTMLSTSLDLNPEHYSNAWYSSYMEEDARRVTFLYKEAQRLHMPLTQVN